MTLCNCKCSCSLYSAIVALILGVVAAFLQITGTITVTTAFLWVVFGIAIGYLGILLLSAGVCPQCRQSSCVCNALWGLLTGALGSVLLSVVLLAVGIVATSILSAILVGLLILSFTLLIANAACLIRHQFDCGN